MHSRCAKIFPLMLAMLLMCLCPEWALATQFEGDDWVYRIVNGAAVLDSYLLPFPQTLIIPSEVDGYAVRRIDDFVDILWYEDMDEYTKAVESVYNVRTLVIPSSVQQFNAVLGLPELTTYEVSPESQYYTSIDGVLYTKDMQQLVSCPAKWNGGVLYVPESVQYIGDLAFYDCQIGGVVLPDDLREIGYGAFTRCSFPDNTGLYVPDKVTTIVNAAFEDSYITDIHIPRGVKNVGISIFNNTSEFNQQTILVHAGDYMERYVQAYECNYDICTSCEDTKRLMMESLDVWSTDRPAEQKSPSAMRSYIEGISCPLQKGDKGAEVQKLQVALIEANFLYETDDGIYGNATATAVKTLQRMAARPETGIFETGDKEALTAGYAAAFEPQGEGVVLIYDAQQDGNHFYICIRNTGSQWINSMYVTFHVSDKNHTNIEDGSVVHVFEVYDLRPGQTASFFTDLSQMSGSLKEGKKLADISFIEFQASSVRANYDNPSDSVLGLPYYFLDLTPVIDCFYPVQVIQ